MPNILNDLEFFNEVQYLKDYFNDKMLSGLMGGGHEEAYRIFSTIYDVVFNSEILYSKQEALSNFLPVKEYDDGINFIKSELGSRFIDVIFYFSYFYKVPSNQLGGYNIVSNSDNKKS